ncbi:cyclopropane-fatty-acyl-phospholipid synthase family protein [Bacillus sp. Marseille-Q3570]|uniref:SAM-dependent methyltransferase n=1 Tax=Bacillus sp. Marseille-Q3570 TaxID=2963522 RepID=UPI0021B72F6F|nr:class I SAM-dependent methyltransferase [Bacillus sp. Marseille-Q3570]
MAINKFSIIAHRNHEICNPISQEKLRATLDHIPFSSGEKVLDIGAGKCGVLIDLIERHGVVGTAIEIEADFIDAARNYADQRIGPGRLRIVNDDAKKVMNDIDGVFDAVICLGATHALGNYRLTLEKMSEVVKPGGYLLVGEGYWKKEPEAAYLEALGATKEELLTHHANIEAGVDLGLIPMWAHVTSEDEWDAYEWLYSSSMEKYCLENPDDPDVAAMRDRIRKWRSTYLRWGRDTLGFGLYLFYKS